MKFSGKIEKCQLSPIRKFAPYAQKAEQKGRKIYHLNIGQPDIETPPAYFEAVKSFSQPVLAYAPSAGMPVLINAIRKYYAGIGAKLEENNILISTGGSEALLFAFLCLLDPGDEIIVTEPFSATSSPLVLFGLIVPTKYSSVISCSRSCRISPSDASRICRSLRSC